MADRQAPLEQLPHRRSLHHLVIFFYFFVFFVFFPLLSSFPKGNKSIIFFKKQKRGRTMERAGDASVSLVVIGDSLAGEMPCSLLFEFIMIL